MEADEEKIKNEMAQNQAMQDYLKQFSQSDIESFINRYAHKKKMWLEFGDFYARIQEEESTKWVDKAAEQLEFIQQKKLFDLQCLWRAETIKLPGIEICNDFCVWQENILNCPLIDPVSRADIDLYAYYLLTVNPDHNYWYREYRWQDYDELKEEYDLYDKDADYPQWYIFNSKHFDTTGYMILPDIRGTKEDFYFTIARNKWREEYDENNPPREEYIPEPSISENDKKQMDSFVRRFENKEVQALYHAFEWGNRNRDSQDLMEYYFSILFDANEPAPMQANKNWTDAVIEAANRYANKKIIEALPEAWEQYMMNLQMKIAFPFDGSGENQVRKNYADGILKGRKLNGEPEDFNF